MAHLLEIKWKVGSRFSGSASEAHEALEKIRKRDGDLTAAAVVKAAKPKRSVLHSHFNWDDKEAARESRLRAARKLIGSIEVVREDAPEVLSRQYEIIRDETEDEAPKRVYQRTEDILQDSELRKQLLSEARASLRAWRRRYAALKELGEVFVVIDNL